MSPLSLVSIKNHLRRRLLIGLIVFAPFALTLWILLQLVNFGKSLLTLPAEKLASLMERISPNLRNPEYEYDYVTYIALAISILLVVLVLYTIGLLSATFVGRQFIAAGESLLQRIPPIKFCYNLFKQVIGIVSMPRSKAFQKVVLIEYPRKGIFGLAFFTGLTPNGDQPGTGDPLVNVFIPTSPNPTSGFLLLLKADEVYETNLTVAEASRFIISLGVVEVERIERKPFQIEKYLKEKRERSIDEESMAPEREIVTVEKDAPTL